METDRIKAELRELFTEAEKLEGDLARHQQNWAHWKSNRQTDEPPDWLIDQDYELVKPFEYLSLSLYLTTVCLLDALGLHVYLNHFYRKFGRIFDAKDAASKYDIEIYVTGGEPYNIFLADLRQFIAPLDVLNNIDRYLKLSGVQYLETILRNTATIIHKTKTIPTSEPQVYKCVRNIFEAVFPTAISPKSNFFKSYKQYKPDVLIPELLAAVEYKYAESEAVLKTTIGQISDDVKGYTGDKDYNLFYAVFYVKNDFWGKDKFNAAWVEKDFPKNWRSFYVVGK